MAALVLGERREHEACGCDRIPHSWVAERLELAGSLGAVAGAEVEIRRRVAADLGCLLGELGQGRLQALRRDRGGKRLAVAALAVEAPEILEAGVESQRHAQLLRRSAEDRAER